MVIHATLDECAPPSGTSESGGKAPITNGTLTLTATPPPGMSCASGGGVSFTKPKLTAKLTNVFAHKDEKTVTTTVARLRPTNVAGGLEGAGVFISILGDIVQNKANNAAFANESTAADVAVDSADLTQCLAGMAPLSKFTVMNGLFEVAPGL
jgi:hypothetical protein